MAEQVRQRLQQLQQTEQELREREEQYRGIFEATYDGLFIHDLDGYLVEVNPSFCHMFGYTREELVGQHLSVLTAPVSRANLSAALDMHKAGGDYHQPGMGLRKDGGVFSADAHSSSFAYRGQRHVLGVVRDISDQVDAERQIRESDEQYRRIFEASTDAIFIMDLDDGHIIEANPAACTIYGYSYEEFIGLPPSAVIHPDRLPAFWEQSIPTIKRGDKRHVQGLNLRKDGSAFPIDLHQTGFTYQSKPCILSIMRDITEQIEAERELREREEQYRSIFEASIDSLVIASLDDSRIVEANPAACTMLGYSYEELIGLTPAALVHPDSLPLVAEGLDRFRQTGRDDTAEVVDVRKDGTTFLCEAHSTQFTYKGTPHLLTVARDITEQVEADRQLREREEQYRSIFESTYDGLLIMDLEGRLVEANPAFCRMYGYTHEEVIGMHVNAFAATPADVPILSDILENLGSGSDPQTFVAHDQRKDGTVFTVESHSSHIIYRGQPHILVVVRDITEQVEAERELREREELYRSIFETTYDGLNILDLDGYYVEVNPAFCQMFGYTRDELIGMHSRVTATPSAQPSLSEALDTFRGGREYQTTGRALRKDGSTFAADAHGSPITYRGKSHSLGVVRDITEQVEAQQLLEERVQVRTRELTSLLQISQTVTSTLHLQPVLGLILEQLQTVVDYSGAVISTVEGDELVILDARSTFQEAISRHARNPVTILGPLWERLTAVESILLPDVGEETPLAQAFGAAISSMEESAFASIRSALLVPLVLKEQMSGLLVLTADQSEAFTPHQATLCQAIANQAAIAIENARLYEQAQALAALEERQKLARELHDSVSQALYGISLGAHSARTALRQDPELAAEPLDYVLSLAEAGLAEMRALIFELRPQSLESEGLVSALSKQGAAVQARHELRVDLDLGEEPELPLYTKQELYRIAQEALHNTVKHARASQVEILLSQTADSVRLEIRDNGVGFDPGEEFPGHLGLHSMRERVSGLGGTLRVESTPGQGTALSALVPNSPTA
jgi:PAS domain S-box-containing protein